MTSCAKRYSATSVTLEIPKIIHLQGKTGLNRKPPAEVLPGRNSRASRLLDHRSSRVEAAFEKVRPNRANKNASAAQLGTAPRGQQRSGSSGPQSRKEVIR